MCGLIGVVTKSRSGFTQEQKNIAEFLLFLDTLRGDDSTGTMLVSNSGNVDILKDIADGTQFIKKSEFKGQLQQAWTTGWSLFGHNRKATRGATKEENAHPFWVDNKIVLMHNGTMVGDHKHIADVEVDSHAIAHHLQDAHTAEEVEKALQGINAAYALIWYDVENKRINMIRNDERPLYHLETNDAYYFASEGWMLSVAAIRFGVKNAGRPELLKSNLLVQIQLGEDKSTEVINYEIDPKYRRVGTGTFPGSSQASQYDADYWAEHPFQRAACAYDECDEQSYAEAQRRLAAVATRSRGEARAMAEAILEAAEKDEEANGEDTQARSKVTAGCVFSREGGQQHRHADVNRVLQGLGYKYTASTIKEHGEKTEGYAKGQKIQVEIIGLTEADNNPKTDNFILIGRTRDQNKNYVAFPFKSTDFDSLIRMDTRSVFEVIVEGSTWSRLDTNGTTDIADFTGISIIHAKHPTPVITNTPPKDTHVVH